MAKESIYSESSKTSRYRKRFSKLRDEQSDWRSHWQDISQFLLPRRGRYLNNETYENFQQQGQKKHQKIINGSAVQALKTLAGGLQGGLTSPSRPWFRLTIADDDLAENQAVKEWLHSVQEAMLAIFQRSNFYGAIHYVYWELGAFGTAAMLIEEDMESIIRCRPMTIGEYALALDCRYRPSCLYRQFSMTAAQMQEKFGQGNDKMGNLPQSVISALRNGQPDVRFEVQHILEKNAEYDKNKSDARGKEYSSIYYPYSGDDEELILRKSGYNSIPFIAPRWEVTGVDTYGNSPAMDALGDVKMLQKIEEKKLMALDKMVNPPMNAPVALKNQGATTVSGGVNWIDVAQGQQSFQPAYLVNPNLQQMAFEIDRVEKRIRGFFFNDLFLSVLGADKDMTAFEVAKRHEEKLMLLGPIIERQQAESMDLIIDRVFKIMVDLNLLPPIPREIAGAPLKVVYVSLLAQAQKMVATAPIDQLVGFVGNVAQANPSVLDKVDFDEMVDQYAQALGTPPKIIKPDDVVAAGRQQKQQDMRAQQAVMAAKDTTQAAKNLGETPIRGGDSTALDALLGAAGGVNPTVRR